MATQFDGTIKIDTKIDHGGFLKGFRKMFSQSQRLKDSISGATKEIDRMQKELNDLQNAPLKSLEMSKARDNIRAASNELEALKKKLNDIQNAPVESPQITEATNHWETTEEEYDKLCTLRGKYEKEFADNLGGIGSQQIPDQESLNALLQNDVEWKNITEDISKAESKANEYFQALEVAKVDARNDLGMGSIEVAIEEKVSELKKYLKEYSEAESNAQAERDSVIEKQAQAIDVATKKLEASKDKLDKVVNKEVGKEVKIPKTANIENIAKQFDSISNIAKKGFGSITKSSSKSMDMLEKLNKSVKRFTNRIWGVFSSALVFSILTKAFTSLREKIAATTKQNAQFSASMAVIRGNASSAFNTLITAAMPALNSLMSVIAKATTYLNTFISLLFGKTVKSANAAASATNGQAAALDKAGKAAKKASEYLNAYDEMNVQASDNDSSGGGGGGGSDLTYTEDADVEGQVAKYLDRIKKAWEKADFTEFGTMLGNKINGVLENIDWSGIQTGATKLGKSLATFLNGFFETPGLFSNVGKTIAESLNTAIDASLGFAENFHFDSAGQAIADTVNGFFKTFDTTGLAQSIHLWIQGALTLVSTMMKNTDFEQIGNKIGDFLAHLDLTDFLDDIASIVWEAIKGGFDLLKGMFQEAPLETALIAAFGMLKFTGLGSSIAGKIGKSITDHLTDAGSAAWSGLSSVGSTIYTALGKACANATSAVATLASKIAGGITTAIGNVGTFLTTDIATVFSGGAASIAAGLFAAIGAAIAGWKIGQLIYDKFSEQIDDIVFKVGDFFTKTIPQALNNAGKAVVDFTLNVKTSVEDIKQKAEEKWNEAKNWFDDKKYQIAVKIDDIKSKASSLWSNAKDWAKDKDLSLGVKFSKSAKDLYNDIKEAWGKVSGKTFSIGVKLSDTAKGLFGDFKTAWGKIKTKLKFPMQMPHISWGTTQKTILGKKISVPSLNVKWYANGGFPDMGQLFIARERGAEMVGNIGGKTAVANNDQITTAIAAAVGPAVYDAMMSAMANGDSGQINLNLELGGQKITDYVIQDVKNRTFASGGRNPILV